MINRPAAPEAKGGERRGEREQEGGGRGSSQSGPRIKSPFPARAKGGNTQYKDRLLGSAGFRSAHQAQSVHSSLGERGLTTPSVHRQTPHRRARGVPGQSSRREEDSGEEGGALVVLQGGGPLWGFRPPPVTHWSRTSARPPDIYLCVGSQRPPSTRPSGSAVGTSTVFTCST